MKQETKKSTSVCLLVISLLNVHVISSAPGHMCDIIPCSNLEKELYWLKVCLDDIHMFFKSMCAYNKTDGATKFVTLNNIKNSNSIC
jgi:hypothetical protein